MLNQSQIQKIKQALQKYPVLFGYIFGSWAKSQTGLLSDLDIALYFSPKNSQEERTTAADQIEIALKELFPKISKIDLIVLNDTDYLTPLLEREIVYEGKLIYSIDENARAHWESLAIAEWLDWEPYQKAYDEAVLRHS
jgi:predicted nucleotidyltransferase